MITFLVIARDEEIAKCATRLEAEEVVLRILEEGWLARIVEVPVQPILDPYYSVDNRWH